MSSNDCYHNNEIGKLLRGFTIEMLYAYVVSKAYIIMRRQ